MSEVYKIIPDLNGTYKVARQNAYTKVFEEISPAHRQITLETAEDILAKYQSQIK